MAKRTRARVRRASATQSARHPRKTTKPARKAATQETREPASESAQNPGFAQTKQASLTRRRTYTPEFLAYARQRFERTEDSLADIGLDLGISSEAVRVLAIREKWKRYVRPPHGLPPVVKRVMRAEVPDHQPQEQSQAQAEDTAVSAQAEGDGTIPPLADTIAQLHRAVLDELAAIETSRADSRRVGGSARTARMLASLTETLQKLQRMQPYQSNPGTNDDDMPADIDEFRRELARRIEAFVLDRTNAGNGREPVTPATDAEV